ncbi:MbnH family di-heme enzyme [Sorangium sp. So ce1014]|uniref:MbnH family di-heme enzyme n=1 Tax=Sorangium sp. So ce1014 TaxID=3133326 RepID=UPI003F648416
MTTPLRLVAVGVSLAAAACAGSETPREERLDPARPAGFPEMAIPEENLLTEARFELGRHIFYDERLSANESQSCASCHKQELAFTDGEARPVGSTGEELPRNAQPLANVGYLPVFTWANPILRSLEEQARVPIFGDFPIELGATGNEEVILARFRGDLRYQGLFREAYPEDDDPITFLRIVEALASFERMLVSGDSPFDRYVQGLDDDALSPSAKRGVELFNSERCECYHCHEGFNFTTAVRTANGESSRTSFVNTGLYNIDGDGAYPDPNTGLFDLTDEPTDMGKFRVPTLRNVEVTAPYMHDGSITTLEDVIDHYAAGGRTIEGERAGEGSSNPYKDALVRGFDITAEEKADLIAFLKSLTDTTFLHDPRFASPFGRGTDARRSGDGR